MFQGAHAYRIDEKGRLKLPADFVAPLGEAFTITRGHSGCLWILPQADWQEMVARLRGDEIKMVVTGIVGARAWNHLFEGRIRGDSISGQLTISDGNQRRSFPWTASR